MIRHLRSESFLFAGILFFLIQSELCAAKTAPVNFSLVCQQIGFFNNVVINVDNFGPTPILSLNSQSRSTREETYEVVVMYKIDWTDPTGQPTTKMTVTPETRTRTEEDFIDNVIVEGQLETAEMNEMFLFDINYNSQRPSNWPEDLRGYLAIERKFDGFKTTTVTLMPDGLTLLCQ